MSDRRPICDVANCEERAIVLVRFDDQATWYPYCWSHNQSWRQKFSHWSAEVERL